MTGHLVLSFRFLSPWFHGRGDGGEPEWPPSPLRAYQALVAAAARAGNLVLVREALHSLESTAPPMIIASEARILAQGHRLSVPHNAMDLVARQWARGGEGNSAEHRAMKGVRPVMLPDDAVVHYVWTFPNGAPSLPNDLVTCARQVVALGWGVDHVVGDGTVMDSVQVSALGAALKTWVPAVNGHIDLRTPMTGTLRALEQRHEAFLSRTSLADPTLRPAPALTAFKATSYTRTDAQAPCPVAVFTLMRPDEDRLRAFETATQGMIVAGMLRHAVRMAAERSGWEAERTSSMVMGHGAGHEPRFLLVPVPSFEFRGQGERVGAVRRVMLFSSDQTLEHVAWARRALAGAELIDEDTGEIKAVLSAALPADRAFGPYLGESNAWTTVTPMVLPGYDDPGRLRQRLRSIRDSAEQRQLLGRLARRREVLIRKALQQAGLADELVAAARIETRDSGFLAGVERSSGYAIPRHLSSAPRTHVTLTWDGPVRGPLCIGSGRFSGLGLLARATQHSR